MQIAFLLCHCCFAHSLKFFFWNVDCHIVVATFRLIRWKNWSNFTFLKQPQSRKSKTNRSHSFLKPGFHNKIVWTQKHFKALVEKGKEVTLHLQNAQHIKHNYGGFSSLKNQQQIFVAILRYFFATKRDCHFFDYLSMLPPVPVLLFKIDLFIEFCNMLLLFFDVYLLLYKWHFLKGGGGAGGRAFTATSALAFILLHDLLLVVLKRHNKSVAPISHYYRTS